MELLIAIVAFTSLIGYVNALTCIRKYKHWIKGEELISAIPYWKGTKKPLIWYLIWSFFQCLSLPGFILLAILGGEVEIILAPFIFTFLYIIMVNIICEVIITIKKSKKKNNDSDLSSKL